MWGVTGLCPVLVKAAPTGSQAKKKSTATGALPALMMMNYAIKKRPRRAFGKRPPAVRQLICEDSRRWLSIKEASMMLAQRPAAWAVIWRVLWARIANSSHGAKSEAEAMRSVLVDTDCEWNDSKPRNPNVDSRSGALVSCV